MNPDGFGFDSSVNYLGDHCAQTNSPGVRQAISLPLLKKSKVMLALSLDYLRSCLSFPANMRPGCWSGMNEEKERLNVSSDEIETLMMNRAACVSAEGELPNWVQRWLSCWKGQKKHNGAPVQVMFLRFAESQLECPKLFTQEKRNSILNLCIYISFFCIILVVQRTNKRTRIQVWLYALWISQNKKRFIVILSHTNKL